MTASKKSPKKALQSGAAPELPAVAGDERYVETPTGVDRADGTTRDQQAVNQRLLKEISERRKVEEELRRSEAGFRSIFENTGAAMTVVTPAGKFTQVNEAFCHFLGYSEDELLQLAVDDVTHTDDLEDSRRQISESAGGKREGVDLVKCYIRKDEKKVWGHVTASWVFDEDSRPLYGIAMVLDVTENVEIQQVLQESEERYRTLFEESKDAIYTTSRDGRFVDANRSTVDLLGYTLEEIVGLNVQEIYNTPEDRLRFQQEIETFGSVREYEVQFRRKDGTPIDCLLTATLQRDGDGNIVGYQGIIRDITERKRTERQLMVNRQQLRRLAAELLLTEEQERRRIAVDLHDHIGQALAIAQIKLGALRACLDSPQQREAVSEVYDLVDQTVQDSSSLTFELSPPVLYELGFEAGVSWLARHVNKSHGLHVVVENDGEPKPLDEEISVLLFRALRELLINVVKHAQVGEATVQLQREADYMRIEIADEGIGFDSSQAPERAAVGGGFGLFSIRERLALLGGTFQVHSAPGRGTRCTLMAPLHATGEGS